MKRHILSLFLALFIPSAGISLPFFLGQEKPEKEIAPSVSAKSASIGKHLFQAIQEKGGFTYQPMLQHTPKRGFAVSIFKDSEKVFDLSNFSVQDLKGYLHQHQEKFQDPKIHIGGWVEKGKVYLDLSAVVNHRGFALKLGIDHQQSAIFDLNQGEAIPVPSTQNEIVNKMPTDSMERNMILTMNTLIANIP